MTENSTPKTEPHYATVKKKGNLSGLFKYCRTNLVSIFKRKDPLNNQFDALKSYSTPFLFLQFQKLVYDNKDDLGQVFSQLGILIDKLSDCEDIEITIDQPIVKSFLEKIKSGKEVLKSIGFEENGKFVKSADDLFGIGVIDHIKIDLEFAKYLLDNPTQRSSTLAVIEKIYKRRQDRQKEQNDLNQDMSSLNANTGLSSPSLVLSSVESNQSIAKPALLPKPAKSPHPAGDILSDPGKIAPTPQPHKINKAKIIIERLNVLSKKKIVDSQMVAACVNMSLSENLGEGTAKFETWCKVGLNEKIKHLTKESQNQLLIKYGSNGTFKPEDVKTSLQKENGNCQKAVALCVKTRVNSVKTLKQDLNTRCSKLNFKFSDKDVRLAIKSAGSNEADIVSHLNFQFPAQDLNESLRKEKFTLEDLEELKSTYAKSKISDAIIRSMCIELSVFEVKAKHTLELLKDSEVGLHPLLTVRNAVVSNSSKEAAQRYLSVECPICCSLYTRDEMEQSHICNCQLCLLCYEQWLNTTVKEKDPSFWTCPTGLHDDEDVDHDCLSFSFTFLQIQIQTRFQHLNIEEIFRNKVNEWGIRKESNFKWCGNPKCQNGFVYERDDPKMTCPHCRKTTCKDCGKLWTDDHNGRSCQEFEEFLLINDPDIANALKVLGIQCPSCKMRFEEARGGCMHFTCTKCRFEFCAGCKQPFKKAEACGKFDDCHTRGLHSHHPRNCLYFIRDWAINDLEALLNKCKINYKPEKLKNHKKCQLTIANENFTDYLCDQPVLKFDLCEKHCKELLVAKINMNKLDPAESCSADEMQTYFTREKKEAPQKLPNESNENYLTRLREIVKKDIPIY